jgi:hypothetical protein
MKVEMYKEFTSLITNYNASPGRIFHDAHTGVKIDYFLFYVPLKNFSPIWRHHHSPRRAAKFRPRLAAQGL